MTFKRKRLNAVQLIKVVKSGLRRSLQIRWGIKLSGVSVMTSEALYERMYRGNTPYLIGKVKVVKRTYSSAANARSMLQMLLKEKYEGGFRSKHTKMRLNLRAPKRSTNAQRYL